MCHQTELWTTTHWGGVNKSNMTPILHGNSDVWNLPNKITRTGWLGAGFTWSHVCNYQYFIKIQYSIIASFVIIMSWLRECVINVKGPVGNARGGERLWFSHILSTSTSPPPPSLSTTPPEPHPKVTYTCLCHLKYNQLLKAHVASHFSAH